MGELPVPADSGGHQAGQPHGGLHHPQAAFSAYSDYFHKASADYQQEWAELMIIGQSSASEATSCAQQVVDAASHPVSSKVV